MSLSLQKKYFFIGCFCFLVLPVYSMESAEYEKHIHNIYLKNYKNPVSHSDWNEKIQSLPEKYKLKFKDSLWDLSGSFFKDSLYWSKIWVANPQVENPHKVYKGNFIKFDHQSLARVNSSEYSVDMQAQFPGLVIPKNEFSRGALSEENIPSSLPKILRFQKFVDESIDSSQLKDLGFNQEIIVPSYLTDKEPLSIGRVVSKNAYGEFIGSKGEELIVRFSNDVSVGSVFTVFENRGRVGGWKGLFSGLTESEIMIKGYIKIVSYIQGTDSLYLASVVEATGQIYNGDLLFAGKPEVYVFSKLGTEGQGSGLIIGSPYKNQKMLSVGSTIYLNKGSSSGIRKGDIFFIKGQTENIRFKRPYEYKQPILGKLKIIHTSSDVATAIILNSKEQIYLGDMFSGVFGIEKELEKSVDHEKIEIQETLKQGKDLLIDVEEVEKNEEDETEDQGELRVFEEDPGEAWEEVEDSEEDSDELEGPEGDTAGDSDELEGPEEDTAGDSDELEEPEEDTAGDSSVLTFEEDPGDDWEEVEGLEEDTTEDSDELEDIEKRMKKDEELGDELKDFEEIDIF